MNLTRCSSGHFYDSDKYGSCPHCASSQGFASGDMTAALKPDDMETVALVPEDIKTATKSLIQPEEDPKTVSYASQKIGTEPVVGWLVIAKGADMGMDFRLKTGRNFIGRSSSMDIVLKNDKTVSREKHGIVVYDPKSCTYIVQPGTSKELCYLNDEVVLSPQVLKPNDIITVGETDLIFIPLCSKDGFNWNKD